MEQIRRTALNRAAKSLAVIGAAVWTAAAAACGPQTGQVPKRAADQAESSLDGAENQTEATGTDTVTLTLANNHPDGFCTTVALEWFADEVRERTDGRVVIEVYNNGRLGDTVSCLEQMQYGGVDIVKADVPTMANFVKDFNALQMPYIYESEEHFQKVHGGEIGMDLLRGKAMKEKGMYGLTYYDAGTRCFYNSRRPMHSIRDMKGMTIRIQESNLMVSMIQSLGAQPVATVYSEVYQALESRMVDGADNSMVNYLEQSFYEVAPYFLEDNHTRSADMLVMSEESRGRLTGEELEIFDDTALESWEYQKKLWNEAEAAAREKLLQKDVVITGLPEEDFAYVRELCRPLWYDYDDRDEFLNLLDRIVAAGR